MIKIESKNWGGAGKGGLSWGGKTAIRAYTGFDLSRFWTRKAGEGNWSLRGLDGEREGKEGVEYLSSSLSRTGT